MVFRILHAYITQSGKSLTAQENIIIVGGGLTGLTLAYLLSKKNISPTIVEADSRLGGRIQTIKGINETPLELGATWFSDIHLNLIALIDELQLTRFPQFSKGISLFQTKSFEPPQSFFIPEAETPSYRLAGGTQTLVGALLSRLNAGNIHLKTKVRAILQKNDGLVVETGDGRTFTAGRVIICTPPQLAAASIVFTPALPDAVLQLLPTVQTWMAGAVKFVLEYDEPFWRNSGHSGMLYSHAGVVAEMYDHTNMEETGFGFTGFLNGAAAGYSREMRKELVVKQLGELLGEKAITPLLYDDKVWANEYISSGSVGIQSPHQSNGHPLLQELYMNGCLHFCNTETATQYPGYMEGAVIAAQSLLNRLL